MNNKDWSFLIVFILTSLVLIFPWKIEFVNRGLEQVYFTILVIGIALPFVYCIWRQLNRIGKSKMAFRISLFIGILIGTLIITANVLAKPPHLTSYLPLYSNPDNIYETIAIVHDHQYIRSWNGTKRIKYFPKIGVSFRRTFDQKQLNGNWIIDDANPYFELSGQFKFLNGVIVKEN